MITENFLKEVDFEDRQDLDEKWRKSIKGRRDLIIKIISMTTRRDSQETVMARVAKSYSEEWTLHWIAHVEPGGMVILIRLQRR